MGTISPQRTSPWGRGRSEGPGEGAFWLSTMLKNTHASIEAFMILRQPLITGRRV